VKAFPHKRWVRVTLTHLANGEATMLWDGVPQVRMMLWLP